MATTARAVRYDELEGKTVAGAGYGFDRMLIAFTDGTVLALEAEPECDGGSQIDFAQGRDIDLLCETWAGEAHEAGAISDEQFRDARKKHGASRVKRLERELNNLNERLEEERKSASSAGG